MSSEPRGDGTIRFAPFELPVSDFLDTPTRSLLHRWTRWVADTVASAPGHWSDAKAIPAVREYYNTHFYPVPVERTRTLYDVRMQSEVIAGVRTEVFTPAEGLSPSNTQRVLINLHGGGFAIGAPFEGRLESIPVAAIGKIKVISVDYSMAPEHRFPAATEDVLKVYRHLLKTHDPRNIGLYGVSAGAVLTAQTVARLLSEDQPMPGAIGMLSAAGCHWTRGDSSHFAAAMYGKAAETIREHPYFAGADPHDPLVSPIEWPEVLAKFPPSLLIGATRDLVLSSVVHMHSRLVALGVEASLHVWEGLDHAFFHNPDLPQSREVHDVTVRFFQRYLGRS